MTVQEFYEAVGGDYTAAKKILMNDRMIRMFLPKIAEDPCRAKLETAWKKQDRKEMFEALHAMKGVCANLGLTSLSRKASDALEPIRPGTDQTISEEELSGKVAAVCEQFDATIAKVGDITL